MYVAVTGFTWQPFSKRHVDPLRPYLTGGDVAATIATDQSRRLGRPKIACALTKAETSPRLLPVYIYLDLQLDLSFDDANTRSVT